MPKSTQELFSWLPQSVIDDGTRLTKTDMKNNISLSKSETKLIDNQMDGSSWITTIRPSSVDSSEYVDSTSSYKELLIVHTELKPDTPNGSITDCQELFHRSIPYHLFLWITRGEYTFISAQPLRHHLVDSEKKVFDGNMAKASFTSAPAPFLDAINPISNHRGDLRQLYYRWMRAIYAVRLLAFDWNKVKQNALSSNAWYLPSTPSEGETLVAEISEAQAQLNKVLANLKQERLPSRRVELGNKRYSLIKQLQEKLSKLYAC
jgi:hypothetical protein